MRSVPVTECAAHRGRGAFENISSKQFKFEALDTKRTVYTDSDCAGCRSIRKSKFGGLASTSVGLQLYAMNGQWNQELGRGCGNHLRLRAQKRRKCSTWSSQLAWRRKDAPHKYGKPQCDRELEVQKVVSEDTVADIFMKNVKSEVLEEHMADTASIKPTRREIG